MIYNTMVKFYELGKDNLDKRTGEVTIAQKNPFYARCNVTDMSYERQFKEFGEKFDEVKVLRMMSIDDFRLHTTHCEFNKYRYAIIQKKEYKGRITLYVRKDFYDERFLTAFRED